MGNSLSRWWLPPPAASGDVFIGDGEQNQYEADNAGDVRVRHRLVAGAEESSERRVQCQHHESGRKREKQVVVRSLGSANGPPKPRYGLHDRCDASEEEHLARRVAVPAGKMPPAVCKGVSRLSTIFGR